MKKNKYPGKFIAIDGPNGSGKSSLIKKLVKELKKEGKDVAVTKEISSSKIGIFAREMMPETNGLAYACLIASDRYEHLKNEVIPMLKEGKIVICDRYAPSSLVYQQMDGVSPNFLLNLNSEIIIPDFTAILTANSETLTDRKIRRAERTGKPLDRFEVNNQAGIELHFFKDAVERLKKKRWNMEVLDNGSPENFEENLVKILETIKEL